jgi:hypothetical protein
VLERYLQGLAALIGNTRPEPSALPSLRPAVRFPRS